MSLPVIYMVLVLILAFGTVCNSYERTFPRGIPLSQRSLYEPLQEFTCLDGSLSIPFEHVNDDYCDCDDGTDEPGTSACPNGRFYCQNIGYVPFVLPASRVNDGLCDCCDTSDEYLSDNCTNNCQLLGAEAKKAAEKEAEIASQGNELRLEMIAAGKQIKQLKQERLLALEFEKVEASRLKEEANRLKQAAETAESAAVEVHKVKREELKQAEEKRETLRLEAEANEKFAQLDLNGDNLLHINELKRREEFDQNRDGQVSEEEFKAYFDASNDVSLDNFVKVWPKIKPTFENKAQVVKGINSNEVEEENNALDEKFVTELSDSGAEEAWDKQEDEEDEENLDQEHIDEPEEAKQEDSLSTEFNKDEENYDEETLRLIEEANAARTRLESAERSFQDVEREFTKLKQSLEKDYGPNDEFVPLDGQCYSFSDREYTYKLCPFDQVTQMGKSGGSETRLGQWAGWQQDSQYKVMIYDKGQACWNGPQRSTKVFIICGLETQVIAAAEPNKCEYELALQTPAACKLLASSKKRSSHDEF